MKKIILGMVLVALIALTGCSSNTAQATETTTEQITTQEETTTVAETAVDRLRAAYASNTHVVNLPGNAGHITITSGAINGSSVRGGKYYFDIADVIDGVIYQDTYEVTKEMYDKYDVNQVYTFTK